MTKRAAQERKIVTLAMRDYTRLRKLGWTRLYLGGIPQRLWDACAALARHRRRGK